MSVTDGAGSFSLCGQNVSDFMLKKKLLPLKIELLVILNRFGLILLWRPQQMWITYPFHMQNWTIGLSFKNKKICKHVEKPHSHPLPFRPHKCMVPYKFMRYEFFSVLQKITFLFFEQKVPIVKMLLKDTSKPYNCGSSVEVNDISDSILWNFVWQNATNIYFTKKQLPLIGRILQFQVTHVVIVT